MTTTMTGDPVELLYRATTTPRLVEVPALTFLCVDGHGDPNTSPAYAEAIQALYAVSYAAKFAVKKETGQDVKVSALEGLWWADDVSTFLTGDKSAWDWTMMIRQPAAVTAELVERLAAEVADKKPLPAVAKLRLVTFEEGPAAQVLHVGPYAAEGPTIERLHAFLRDQGLALGDPEEHKHHEIYLGDPRRAAPEKLRTIIRQPYAPSLSRHPRATPRA
ncbi:MULTISPECIES: GyrI-like domain-containing protein [unclassified Nocardioides]|uniref:GyrI-like domain-containing protein n=1 Tax=unclassified Nocardioides TaxID=2615069 RepID=UPI0009F05039|nr:MULTISPECIES: GyrI-like domain-containing protein [unclassified Nocardioides]GAW51158.1 uncharacterized protein PD653B2_3497 [Nocardioides sp. PD653-B2]GAW56886.1 uncharacterized protein PD653_4326 [Nocardioides sp. PD653]